MSLFQSSNSGNYQSIYISPRLQHGKFVAFNLHITDAHRQFGYWTISEKHEEQAYANQVSDPELLLFAELNDLTLANIELTWVPGLRDKFCLPRRGNAKEHVAAILEERAVLGLGGLAKDSIPVYPYDPEHRLLGLRQQKNCAETISRKACNLCRTRRKGCSKDLPACARCIEFRDKCEYPVSNRANRAQERSKKRLAPAKPVTASSPQSNSVQKSPRISYDSTPSGSVTPTLPPAREMLETTALGHIPANVVVESETEPTHRLNRPAVDTSFPDQSAFKRCSPNLHPGRIPKEAMVSFLESRALPTHNLRTDIPQQSRPHTPSREAQWQHAAEQTLKGTATIQYGEITLEQAIPITDLEANEEASGGSNGAPTTQDDGVVCSKHDQELQKSPEADAHGAQRSENNEALKPVNAGLTEPLVAEESEVNMLRAVQNAKLPCIECNMEDGHELSCCIGGMAQMSSENGSYQHSADGIPILAGAVEQQCTPPWREQERLEHLNSEELVMELENFIPDEEFQPLDEELCGLIEASGMDFSFDGCVNWPSGSPVTISSETETSVDLD